MDQWIELKARSLKAQNTASLEKLNRMGDPGLWNSWVAQHLNLDDWVVVEQSVESYMLPAATERYLPGALITDWKGITSEIREIHNELVGLRISLVEVILSGDDRCQVLDERLRDWATRYVMHRVDRGRRRGDDSVLQFNRMYLELLPKLEEIAFRQGSANRCFMAEFTAYLPWILFEQTWRPLLEVEFNHEELYPRFRVLAPTPEAWQYLVQKAQLYQWANSGDIAIILDRVGLPFQQDKSLSAA